MATELKPCPFCGEMPTVKDVVNVFGRVLYSVQCDNPECANIVGTKWLTSPEATVKAWNRRVGHDRNKV